MNIILINNIIKKLIIQKKMINVLMRRTNIFAFDNFWKANGDMSYSSACGGIVSLPLLVIIFILLVLQAVQMFNYGIVMSQTQINYSYEPPLTTISTKQNDPNYTPFMAAFAVDSDNSSCPNSAISFEVFVNEVSGSYGTKNRASSKTPLNLQICSADHFSMLPGKLDKIKQWTASQLYCLPTDSYLQIGGSNTISDLYKNIQFRFACPSSCSASMCGAVEFYSVSSTINIGNTSSPQSYYLTRNKFSILSAPKFQIQYRIDVSNITTDNSIFPFSLNSLRSAASLGNVITDIPTTAGDNNTYVTLERSDKSTIYKRSFYKIFDLVAYMGGIVNGILILLFFIRNFSKIEFELNFAAEYFRVADSKLITFRGYIKQLFYQFFKNTRFSPNWQMAAQRQELREAANRVLDVIYLNKRVAFLQEAISLIFQRHQLKGIHLIHSFNKQQLSSRINAHRFRDRLVYFLGKKYKYLGVSKQYQDIRFKQSQTLSNVLSNKKSSSSEMHPELQRINHAVFNKKAKDANKNGQSDFQELKFSVHQTFRPQSKNMLEITPVKMTLKDIISRNRQIEDNSLTHGPIINEAEKYYQELAQRQKQSKDMANTPVDNSYLKNQLKFVGDLSYQELNEVQLMQQLGIDMKKLIEEAQSSRGSEVTKKIYAKLDQWLKNYLRATIREMDG